MGELYVPVHVEALVVGKGGQRVKNMRSSFSALEKKPLGETARVEPDAVTQLRPGVHLHWTMPDSLLHGVKEDTEEDTVRFPVLPDRWIIQRLEKLNGRIERKVWQITSNAVHLYDPDEEYGNSSITVPMYENAENVWRPSGPLPAGKTVRKPYGYLGHCELLSEGSSPFSPRLTVPLTAVGWGEPHFAAAYQKCASCFGFWDEITEEGGKDYTYVVCGYYACHEEDPLRTMSGDIKEALSWTIADGDNTEIPSDTVCHGTVCHVMWPGKGKQIKNGVPEGEVEVTVGNNSAEALSALLQGQHPGERGMERLLLYHQQDTWEKIRNAESDSMIQAEEEAHRRQFSDVLNGYRYELERADEKLDFDALPVLYYKNLEALNDLQDTLENLQIRKREYAQRLYVFWCKYIFLYDLMDENRLSMEEEAEKELKLCVDEMRESRTLYEKAREEGEAAQEDIRAMLRKLQKELQDGTSGQKNIRIVKKEKARGYQPNPPVIAVHGKGVKRSRRQGFQADSDGLLPCRLHTVTRKTLRREGKTKIVSADEVKRHMKKKPGCMPEFCECVAVETVLLDDPLSEILWEDTDGIEEWLWEEECGPEPFSIALCQWKQPWNPMELIWEVTIEPFIRQFDEEDILRNFTLGDIDLEWRGEAKDDLKSFTVSGSTLLTPHAAYVMKDRLRLLTGDEHPLLFAVGQQETLSQQMESFYEDCLGMKDTMQIPVYWGKWDEKDTKISLDELQSCITEPVFEPNLSEYSEYLPIRSGTCKITKLWIVDSFGQIKEVQTWEKEAVVHIAESLRADGQKKFLLPPRILNACTLTAKWLCAREDLKSAATPETTPVCGFIRPDLIHKKLTFYDNCGSALGSLETAGDRCHFTPFSENVSKPEDIPDSILRQFAMRLVRESAALRELFEYLALYFEHCLNAEKDSFYQLCFGKVLVLARVSINVESVDGYSRYLRTDAKDGAVSYGTNGYEKCRFLMRMGDERKCRDGLAGFFLSDKQRKLPDMEKLSATDISAARYGKSFICARDAWTHTLEEPSQVLTLLFDPFSEINIRTGLLPVQTLKLEEYFFMSSVEKMETVFPAWPILHPADTVQMPMPEAENKKWGWLSPAFESVWQEDRVSVPTQDLYSGRKIIEEGYVKLQKGEDYDKRKS